VWEGIDVLACPTMPTPPFPVTPEALYGPIPGSGFDMSRLRFTAPYDFNGAPTLSVPCGLNGDGLLLSLQFVGTHLGEPVLCRIGHAYEQATTWHTLRPPVSSPNKECL
jgi:amidase